MKPTHHNSRRSRAGFTLIEILVVLIIASILAAVTLGGYSAMRASNARTSCQANMAQIYQAIRLYTADNAGMVPYYDPTNTLGAGTGIGLWALYGFEDGGVIADANIKPEERYLSNPKLFHCPWDRNNEQLYLAGSSNTQYDPAFLSYQVEDPNYSGVYTYQPVRTTVLGTNWQRQLLHYDGTTFVSRPPTDNTIIFWCPFHRTSAGKGEDNVLFWDGTVQSVPVDQGGATGADRLPEAP